VNPFEFCDESDLEKNTAIGLSFGEVIVVVVLCVLMQYQNVTQTDAPLVITVTALAYLAMLQRYTRSSVDQIDQRGSCAFCCSQVTTHVRHRLPISNNEYTWPSGEHKL